MVGRFGLGCENYRWDLWHDFLVLLNALTWICVISTGPIIILGGYTQFGISWTFAVITVAMVVPMVNLFCIRERILNHVQPEEEIQEIEIKSVKWWRCRTKPNCSCVIDSLHLYEERNKIFFCMRFCIFLVIKATQLDNKDNQGGMQSN